MKKQIEPINFIKIMATMCVFFIHTSIFSSQWSGFSFSKGTWFFKTPAWAAVWIFFFISGYCNGGNFIAKNTKYNFELKSIWNFYKKRFLKVIWPTWIFIFCALTIGEPEFLKQNPEVVIKILTLRYYNNPASASIGATWFVFTLAQLYLLTPFICYIISKILKNIYKNKRAKYILLLLCIVLGGTFRLIMYIKGVDWSSKVYVPFYGNLDIYTAGIIFSTLKEEREYKRVKYNLSIIFSLLLFVGVLIINSDIYYRGTQKIEYLLVYQYIFPSIYIIVLCIFIYNSSFWKIDYAGTSFGTRLLDKFASISFEFYLIHSIVLYKISPYIVTNNANKAYFLLLLIGFCVTTTLAILFRNGYRNIWHKL